MSPIRYTTHVSGGIRYNRPIRFDKPNTGFKHCGVTHEEDHYGQNWNWCTVVQGTQFFVKVEATQTVVSSKHKFYTSGRRSHSIWPTKKDLMKELKRLEAND